MSDNTTRPATSGGDTIRDDSLGTNPTSGVEAKDQYFKRIAGRGGVDDGPDVLWTADSLSREFLEGWLAAKCERVELLRALRDAAVGRSTASRPSFVDDALRAGAIPDSLVLSAWWRANYAGAPWAGTASAGSSGTRSLTTSGTNPTAGTAVNGFTPANCSPPILFLVDSVDTWDQFASSTAWSIIVVFKANTAAAPTANIYDTNSFIADDSGGAAIGMGITTSGVQAWHQASATWNGPTVAASTGAWHIAQAKYDGANIKLRVDSSAWSSVAMGSATALAADHARVGISWNGTQGFDGSILEIMLAQYAITDADMDSIKAYVNTRYALSL